MLIILASQTFYPNWPIFLHGYIRHIRDIFQLCLLNLMKRWKIGALSHERDEKDVEVLISTLKYFSVGGLRSNWEGYAPNYPVYILLLFPESQIRMLKMNQLSEKEILQGTYTNGITI